MIVLPITLTSAAAAALTNFWIGFRIGQVRRSAKISVGDGGHEPLIRRMRAHANFVEHAPLVVLLVGLVELAQGSSLKLWILAGLFAIGRVAHALGMEGGRLQPLRLLGILSTYIVEIGLALWALRIASAAI